MPDVVAAARDGDVSGMTIGVVTQFKGDGYQPGVLARFDEAVALLEKAGARVEEVSCPHFDYALPAYYLIAPSEASSNLARYDAMRYGLRAGDDELRSAEEVMALTREAGFGDEVKRRIILGTYALVGRLLRRLLRPGAEGAHPDQPRLRRCIRAGRRARVADDADDRVPAGGARRGPDGDVSRRPLHDPVQPLRRPGAVGALRTVRRRRAAGRLPGDGAGAGRRPACTASARLSSAPSAPTGCWNRLRRSSPSLHAELQPGLARE